MMEKFRTKFLPGDIILITEGAYEDYHIVTIVKTVLAFDATDYPCATNDFLQTGLGEALGKMLENGVVEELSFAELNTCYSCRPEEKGGWC